MQGIKNQPFVDAAPFLPMDELKDLEREICLGIAKSTINSGIYGPGVRDEKTFKSVIGLYTQYAMSASLEDKRILTQLNFNQLSTFFKLYEGMYSASTVVYIRDFIEEKSLKTYKRKAEAAATTFTDNTKNFPNLMKWLEKLPFTEMGRILFFIHEHDCKLLIHRDGPEYTPHKNEFLWLNPCGKKSFFIHDGKTGERHYVSTTAAFFNDLDEHGGDPGSTMTWSLRIDGKFTDEFRKQLGIDGLSAY
jgi:hypothetical protein